MSSLFGWSLAVIGFAHQALGKLIYPSLIFVYGFMAAYSLSVMLYTTWSERMMKLAPPSFWSTAAMGLSIASGIASHRFQRATALSSAIISGVILWVLIFLITGTSCSSPIDAEGIRLLISCVMIPCIAAIWSPASTVIPSTVVIGFGLFSEGLSVLLDEPLHYVVVDACMGHSVALTGVLKFCLKQCIFLAVICFFFQRFFLKSTPVERRSSLEGVDIE